VGLNDIQTVLTKHGQGEPGAWAGSLCPWREPRNLDTQQMDFSVELIHFVLRICRTPQEVTPFDLKAYQF
jgi:hypothetical protein